MRYTEVHVHPCSVKNYCLRQVPSKRATIDFSVVIDVVPSRLFFIFVLAHLLSMQERERKIKNLFVLLV